MIEDAEGDDDVAAFVVAVVYVYVYNRSHPSHVPRQTKTDDIAMIYIAVNRATWIRNGDCIRYIRNEC